MAEDFLGGGAGPGNDCMFCSGWAQNRAVSCLHPGALRTGKGVLPGCPPTWVAFTPPLSQGGVAWPCAPLPLHPPEPRTQAVSMALAGTCLPCRPVLSVTPVVSPYDPHYREETFQVGRVVVRCQGWPLSLGLSTLHLMLFIQPLPLTSQP